MNTIIKIVLVIMFALWFGQETIWALNSLDAECVANQYYVLTGRCSEQLVVVSSAFVVFGIALAFVLYKLVGKVID